MRKNVPNKPNIQALLDLLTSLDGDLLKAIPGQGISIAVTITPAIPDEDDDPDDDDYDDMEDEDGEDCCPDYEPADGEDGRCVYCCPKCGECLREYIGEESGKRRINRQERTARDFVTGQGSKIGGILYVFPNLGTAELGQKIRRSTADD